MVPFIQLLCIIGLPLGLALIAGISWQFRVIPTLSAAVAGEIAGFGLLLSYSQWKAARILSRKESGAVLYMSGHANLPGRLSGALFILGLGVAIGLVVLLTHWAYSRMRSA